MAERVAYFRRKAEQCFRLAHTLLADKDREALEAMGREFQAKAEQASPQAARG